MIISYVSYFLYLAISKKKKAYFQEKFEKNANDSKELLKIYKSPGIKSGKLNQSKIALNALKKDGATQFESTKQCKCF